MKIFILLVVLIGFAAATDFQQCGKGRGPTQVEVEGCEKTPCKLKRGTDVDFRVTFDAGTISCVFYIEFHLKISFP